MSLPNFTLVLLFIVVNLLTLQNRSSAFVHTTNLCRKIRKNSSRFHLLSIHKTYNNRMRQRSGLDEIRVAISRSASISINDGSDDESTLNDHARQSSRYFDWWRKDPQNRSVSGVLISSFLSLLGFTMVAGPLTPALGKACSIL